MPLYNLAISRVLPTDADVYVALLTGAPDNEGVGEVEASYAGYTRLAYKNWVPAKGHLTNGSVLAFEPVAGSAITVVWYGIYPTLVGGALLAAGQVLNLMYEAQPLTLEVGEDARIPAEALKFKWDY